MRQLQLDSLLPPSTGQLELTCKVAFRSPSQLISYGRLKSNHPSLNREARTRQPPTVQAWGSCELQVDSFIPVINLPCHIVQTVLRLRRFPPHAFTFTLSPMKRGLHIQPIGVRMQVFVTYLIDLKPADHSLTRCQKSKARFH
jgi:hypothetical protein